jgi:ABC-type transporter Mla MlaB component
MQTTKVLLNKENDTVIVQGELALETVNELYYQSKELLAPHLATEKAELRVDLASVTHVDSSGLALLCEWKRWHPNVVFANHPAQLQSIAKMSGLEGIL